MIQLTRLNNTRLAVNSDLIKYVEEAPDTVITLLNGEKLVVRETTGAGHRTGEGFPPFRPDCQLRRCSFVSGAKFGRRFRSRPPGRAPRRTSAWIRAASSAY